MNDLHDSRTLPSVLKERKMNCLTDSDTPTGLRVPQIPGSLKVTIFVPMTEDRQKNRLLDPLRACARGNNLYIDKQGVYLAYPLIRKSTYVELR